jgi:hypothetical protein
MEQRKSEMHRIRELDLKGLELKSQIVQEWHPGGKVFRYYSEGLLEYLD